MCLTIKKLHKDDGRKLRLKRVLPALRQSKRVHGNTQHHGACNSWKPRGEIVKLSVSLKA